MKEVITVEGEDVLVREDEARSHRGAMWALLSLLAFLLIAAAMMLGGFLSLGGGDKETPQQIEQQRQ